MSKSRLTATLLAVALVTGSCAGSVASPPSSPSDTNVRPDGTPSTLRVEDAVVRIAESFPVQVFVHVKGALPDPCSAVETITQRRQGNTIVVTVTERRGTVPCAQVIEPVNLSVRLDGTFEAGSYTVVVNGVERTFKI